jgi:hypothetical protein
MNLRRAIVAAWLCAALFAAPLVPCAAAVFEPEVEAGCCCPLCSCREAAPDHAVGAEGGCPCALEPGPAGSGTPTLPASDATAKLGPPCGHAVTAADTDAASRSDAPPRLTRHAPLRDDPRTPSLTRLCRQLC